MSAALFELVAGADPYFTNVDPVAHQYFYLSQDLRVFSVAAGDTPLPGGPTATSDPYATIQSILSFMNSSAAYTTPGPDPLNQLPDQTGYETGDTSVTPLNPANQQNYNFAIARVRLQGDGPSAPSVRMFFRLWVAQSCDTDFQPTTTYPSTPGTSGPDLGLPVFPLASGTGLVDPYGYSIQTIPFFATDAAGTHDYDGTNPNGNIRTITVPMGTDKTWAYFGCFLDVYNASNQSKFPGTHHCIVAQIAYDQTPIVNTGGVTLSPESSDKLAQRNLQITSSGNPGFPQSHRVPQTFDTRPSAPPVATGGLQDYPDELMIDWGNVPVGSLARIYWPQVNVQDVLKLAAKRSSTHRLTAADPNTISVSTSKGVTYVPIPVATGATFAGLFTVDLPNAITVGQELNVQVRRVVSRRPYQRIVGGNTVAVAAPPASERAINWRYVTGTFQVKIPVGDEQQLLRPEENTLAILKWRLEQYPPLYRWRPVLERYIEYIEGRVRGFGGDPGAIEPSPTGLPPIPRASASRGDAVLARQGLGRDLRPVRRLRRVRPRDGRWRGAPFPRHRACGRGHRTPSLDRPDADRRVGGASRAAPPGLDQAPARATPARRVVGARTFYSFTPGSAAERKQSRQVGWMPTTALTGLIGPIARALHRLRRRRPVPFGFVRQSCLVTAPGQRSPRREVRWEHVKKQPAPNPELATKTAFSRTERTSATAADTRRG